MHAIFIRTPESRERSLLLAYDIEDAGLAEALVRSIAHSYPTNGCDERGRVHWFHDALGLHQIWCEASQDGAAQARPAVSVPHREAGPQFRTRGVVA